MTDKVQKIREEVQKIARSINPYIPDDEGKNSEYEAGRFAMVTQIMQIIDSLQEKPVSKDLDEAADCYKDTVTPEEVDDFEHAYSYETYTEYQIADAFKAGALWQREKMLKDAVEAHAFPADNEFLCDFSKIPYFDTWEKVKLIVVKED